MNGAGESDDGEAPVRRAAILQLPHHRQVQTAGGGIHALVL